jgi:hypothetical protein
MRKIAALTMVLGLLGSVSLWGAGRTLSAPTLLESPSPRIAAMAGAATTLPDHSASQLYNPALLTTLRSSQLQLSHNKGFIDDTTNQLSAGSPMKNGAWGFCVTHYDAGQTAVIDDHGRRTVSAQRDLVLSGGAARRFGDFSAGLLGKFFSSELAQTDRATAWAFDAGVYSQIYSRVCLGASVQNVGTRLAYISEKEKLPRVFRAGASLRLAAAFPTTVYVGGAYYGTTAETRPSIGMETAFGPLQVRAGYGTGRHAETFALGTGVAFSNIGLDYSFGLIDSSLAQHRVGVSFQFGLTPAKPSPETFYPLTSPEMTVVEP